jgi:hypothetical protein
VVASGKSTTDSDAWTGDAARAEDLRRQIERLETLLGEASEARERRQREVRDAEVSPWTRSTKARERDRKLVTLGDALARTLVGLRT